jgi:hypothetical protein
MIAEIEKIRELIEEDRLEEAFKLLKELQIDGLKKERVQMNSRFSFYKNQCMRSMYDSEKEAIERNKIVGSVLDLLDLIEERADEMPVSANRTSPENGAAPEKFWVLQNRLKKSEELLRLLFELNIVATTAISPLQHYSSHNNDVQRKEDANRINKAGEAFNSLSKFIGSNGFFFSTRVYADIENIQKLYHRALLDRQSAMRTGFVAREEDLWNKAWKSITEEIPPLKERIEAETRKELLID